jgi:hypothetical protein
VWARGSFGESAENYQFAWSQLITSSGSTHLQLACLVPLCQDSVIFWRKALPWVHIKDAVFYFKLMWEKILTLNFSDQLLAPLADYIPNQ